MTRHRVLTVPLVALPGDGGDAAPTAVAGVGIAGAAAQRPMTDRAPVEEAVWPR